MAAPHTDSRTSIEEALEATSFGRFNYFVIIFSGLVLNNVVLESVGISFVLPVLKCDFNLTSQQQGVLGAVGFIGIIASSHIWGFLADTTGRRKIMLPAILTGFLVTFLSSFAPNFEILAVMRFVNGILLSAGSATVFAYLGEFHCQRHRDRAILSAAFISAVSAIFFPVIAWVFINQNWSIEVPYIDIVYKPWRSYILACGVPGFLCGLLLFYLPESPKYLLSAERQEEAIAVLKQIHHKNTGGNAGALNISSIYADHDIPKKQLHTVNDKNVVSTLFLSMWRQTAPLFMRKHLKNTFLASLIQFIIFFTAHGVYMWFPYILNSSIQYAQRYPSNSQCLCDMLKVTKLNNFTSNVAAEYESELKCAEHLEISTYKHTFVLELIYVSLLLCVSYAIGKFGRKPILFTILGVCGSCGIMALIIEVQLLAIYLFIVLLCCGLATTVVNAIVVDIYPTNLRAMAVCISLMLGRIGSVTGSNILGALIETHCAAALYSSAGALIIAGFLSIMLPSPRIYKDKTIAKA